MLARLISWCKSLGSKPALPPAEAPQKREGVSNAAIERAKSEVQEDIQYPLYPLQPPKLLTGVVPPGKTAPVMALDSTGTYGFDYGVFNDIAFSKVAGFPGYTYLAMLSTRVEYRNFAESLSNELTREWITLTTTEDATDASRERLPLIEKRMEELKVKQLIQEVCEHDAFYGRGQIFIEINGQEKKRKLPLVISKQSLGKNCIKRLTTVEPMWTTPSMYNSIDPGSPNFFKPISWFMMGQEVHASRLLVVVTRELPDILKPAFNFGGMSLSQLTEPYVNNWLRTRQSVSNLIDKFSLVALKTKMQDVLAGGNNGYSVIQRAKLFALHRSNQGLLLLDKEQEELVVENVSLAGLDKLQAQSQEHMCSAAREPAVVLTGISPTGLNVSTEGEMTAWRDSCHGTQESHYREPIQTIVNLVQLDLFGDIDETIGFTFNSLYQMTPKEKAEIRAADATADATYIDRGVLDGSEVRVKIARDPNSGYAGLSDDAPAELNEEPEDDEETPDKGEK